MIPVKPFVASLFLFTAFTFNANAQRWGQSFVLHYRNINSVAILNQPYGLIAAGGNVSNDSLQALYRSDNYGLWWNEALIDTAFSTWITSVAFSDTTHGYGVGYLGKMVYTDDGGRTWAFAHSPVYRNYNKVIYTDSLHAFIAGGWVAAVDTQTILRSSDAGNTWTIVLDTPGNWLNSMSFINAAKGFAVGDSGMILMTADSGNTWTHVASPVERDFNSIAFVNADTGYIVGGYFEGVGAIRTILQTTNGGLNWNILRDDTGAYLKDVYFLDAGHGYMVGDSATLLTSSDGGFTWTPQVVIPFAQTSFLTRYFNSVRFSSPDFGLIGANGGAVYLYSNVQQPTVQTIGAVIQDSADVGLVANLLINGGYPANLIFYYTEDSTWTSYQQTYPGTQTNSGNILYGIGGLRADTTYLFYPQAYNTGGTSTGDTLKFFIPSKMPVLADSLPVNTGLFGAEVKGSVDNLPGPSQIYFEYYNVNGDTPVLTVPAIPATVSDTGFHLVTANITGLLPNQRYLERVKAIWGGDIFYSPGININTANSQGYVTTLNSVLLSTTSARFFGQVDNLPRHATLSFEYSRIGDSTIYTIPGTPASVNDTLQHLDSATVTGLLPYAFYQFRLKAVIDTGIVAYGNYTNFYTGGTILAVTDSATNVTDTSATFNGQVGNVPPGAQIYFSYGYNNHPPLNVPATPFIIGDTLVHTVTAAVDSLMPNEFYNYMLLIVDTYTNWNANPSQFYTGGAYTLEADTATNVTLTSATLNGMVSNLPPGSQIFFNYGLAGGGQTRVDATPAVVNDTLTHTISAQLSGLVPFTLYYFDVVVEDSGAQLTSSQMQFYTGTGLPPLMITTEPAGSITTTSATLNGLVEDLPFRSSIYFKYWQSGQAVDSITGNPGVISDTDAHSISAQVTGLNPNSTYYFQLWAKDSFAARPGDTLQFYTGPVNIPNFDFENWSITHCTWPSDWHNFYGPVTQVSPGYTGNYAVKLEHTSFALSALTDAYPEFHAKGNANILYGGIQYNARPDTLTGMFKYNFVTGDTGYVFIFFKAQGQIISQNELQVTGSSPDTWQQLKFPVSYTSQETPDTLMLGFVAANVFGNGPAITGSWMIIDDLAFMGAYPPIPNGGFENWDTASFTQLDQWGYTDFYDFEIYSNPDSECIVQSTDAWHDHYAAKLVNLPVAGQLVGGGISSYLSQNGNSGPSFPVNHRVNTLNGYYQFYPVNGDTFTVTCEVFKQGVEIGQGNFMSSQPVSSYAYFTDSIIYYDQFDIPDSAFIAIQSYNSAPLGTSWALVDYLSFDGVPQDTSTYNSVTTALANIYNIKIYPNPTTGRFILEYLNPNGAAANLRVSDLSGRTVYGAEIDEPAGEVKKEFEMPGASPGIYLVSLATGGNVITRKLIIIQ